MSRYKEEVRRRGEEGQRRTEAAAEEQRRMAYSEAQVTHPLLRMQPYKRACAERLAVAQTGRDLVVEALLQQQAIKDAQLEAASHQRQHENSKKVLERSVDLADKRDKVCLESR